MLDVFVQLLITPSGLGGIYIAAPHNMAIGRLEIQRARHIVQFAKWKIL